MDDVNRSEEPAEPDKPHGGTVDWMTVSGPARADAWRGLAAFVEDVVFRYNMQFDILPCWWQHRDAVEWLTALWQVHRSTHGPDAALDAEMSWLNTFYNALNRLKGMFQSCREGHIDAVPKGWMPDEVRRAFDAMVAAEAGGSSAAVEQPDGGAGAQQLDADRALQA